MALSGPQTEQMCKALLDAFDKASLRRMVMVRLGQQLEQIADGDNLSDIVFNLVNWADRHNRVLDLIDGACEDNPGNEMLRLLHADAQNWHLELPEEGEPPYQGLHYFDLDDANRFFGREQLTAELVGYLRDHYFLAVIGASGSGKSSVVRAGVVSALASGEKLVNGTLPPKSSNTWTAKVITPTNHPLNTLSSALNQLLNPGQSKTDHLIEAKKLEQALKEGTLQLLDVMQSFVNEGAYPHVLLVVDQFEELFTLCRDKAERTVFIDNLLTAAKPDGVTTVIITLRADFYHHCAEFANLRVALENNQRFIGVMSKDELRDAIEKPAELNKWDFEPGLVDVMLDDVEREPGALPLLSHALLETWNNRRGSTMTFEGYYAAGGVKGAIATRADKEFNELTPGEQGVARNIFVRLTELGEGSEDTRRRVTRGELLGMGTDDETVNGVLQKLTHQDVRLLTVDQEQIEVAHEALIREWPRLRAWLEDNREGLRIHRQLTEVAKEWDHLGRKPGDLYRGTRLDQAEEWAATAGDDLNDLEREFLTASRKQVEAELSSARNRRRWLAIAAAIVLVASIGIALFIANQNRQLSVEKRNALEAQATAEANVEAALLREQALEGERLLSEAYRLKEEELDADGAIAAWQDAVAANSDLMKRADVDGFYTETLRYVATELVLEGEDILRETRDEEDVAIRQSAVISATSLFSQAYQLNPPPDTLLYVPIPGGTFTMGKGDEGHEVTVDDISLRRIELLNSLRETRDEEDVILATSFFSQAYQLNPPPDTLLPGGTFTMGKGGEDHEVTVDDFWLMRTEVTNERYKRCVIAGECEEPDNSYWDKEGSEKLPVTDVSWFQASAYAEWVGGRLPTEAEWEKACRGPDASIYPWGDDTLSVGLANYGYSAGRPMAVGSYPAGAYGLYDMVGNVWEWANYSNDLDDGREDLEGTRPLRGGSWDDRVENVRCAAQLGYDRLGFDPRSLDPGYGFRVASPDFWSLETPVSELSETATATPIPREIIETRNIVRDIGP